MNWEAADEFRIAAQSVFHGRALAYPAVFLYSTATSPMKGLVVCYLGR